MAAKVEYTKPSSIRGMVKELRTVFDSNVTLSYEWRIKQLTILQKLILEGREKLSEAMYKDIHRSRFEAFLLDMNPLEHEVASAIAHLAEWMQPESKPTNFVNQPASSYVKHDARGVVLIMSPWNYPVQLLLAPLVGALAAGNTALLRPATFTTHTSQALQELVSKYFQPGNVGIVTGDRDVTTAVLEERFDYIFFTGGPTLGQVVHRAANKYLTPVTLELGGKSPCIVDESADLDIAVKRIVWGAFINAGQTCVRPDYLLVHKKVAADLIARVRAAISTNYAAGSDDATEFACVDGSAKQAGAKGCPYFGRVVDGGGAIDRLKGIVESDRKFVVEGGVIDVADRFISPTILDFGSDAAAFEASASMKGEIFGPILPILTVSRISDALSIVRAREKPLALYCFTQTQATKEAVQDLTSSGGLVFNDVVVHLTNEDLPFGGVGLSGMGAYHGKHSFETFSHAKGVLSRGNWLDMPARYPPYTGFKRSLIMLLAAPIDARKVRLLLTLAAAAAGYAGRAPLAAAAGAAAGAVAPHLQYVIPLALGFIASRLV